MWPPRQPPRDEIAAEDIAAYDEVVSRARRMFSEPEVDAGYYGRMLLSPQMCECLSNLGRLVRAAGDRDDTYTHAQREVVDQVFSADWGTNVVQALHIPDAVAAGMRIEVVEALRYGKEDLLNDEERLLVTYIRQVVNGAIEPETWNAVEQLMGERGVMEYTIFILFLQLTIRMHQAVGMPDPPDEDIDRLIADLKSGARQAPEFTNRAG